jgi:hypothetical protein
MRGGSEELPHQGAGLSRSLDRGAKDGAGTLGPHAKQKPVAPRLAAFTQGRVQLVFLVAHRPGGNQSQRLHRCPVWIQPGDKRLRVRPAVERGQVVCESAVLEPGLITGHEYPIVAGPKQRAAFRGERLAFLRIRDLGDVWIEMRGTAVRRADVNNATMNAPVGTDVAQPGALSVAELSEASAKNVVLGQPVKLRVKLRQCFEQFVVDCRLSGFLGSLFRHPAARFE